MFEHFTTPDEIFHYKLGQALTMEYDALELLGELEKGAMRSDLGELFHEQARETRLHIDNVRRCFVMLGSEVSQTPSPATKGLAKEAKAFMAKTDSTLVDAVVLAGALEAKHYEMAVYETLLIHTKARGAAEIAELLNQNLLQKQAALEKIAAASDSIVRANIADQKEDGTGAARTAKGPRYLPPGSL